MADYRKELQLHAASVLASGEPLLASVRAMPVGPFGGSMGIFAGAVVGALIQAVAVSRSARRARLSGFPIAGRMVLGVSDRRLLVWQKGGFLGGKITKFVGEVPLTRVARIDVHHVPGRTKMTFVLRDAQSVTVEADERDAPDRFAEAVHRHTPGGISTPRPLPVPPAPYAPVPVHQARSGSAWQAPEPIAPSGVATAIAEEDEGACPRCETRNPSSAEFCWRCFAPLARAPHPYARPGLGGALAGPRASEAPPAPAGSWTRPDPAGSPTPHLHPKDRPGGPLQPRSGSTRPEAFPRSPSWPTTITPGPWTGRTR